MKQEFGFVPMIERPTAFLPVLMSIAALAIVVGHVAMYGAASGADESAAAHLWQLLIVGQLPMVAFFAIKWLPQVPRSAIQVLAIQAIAGLAALAPVYFLHL